MENAINSGRRLYAVAAAALLAVGVSMMLLVEQASAQSDGSVDYTTLTQGLKNDAESGIEQALPIVAFILAATIVVALIRKFVKAR